MNCEEDDVDAEEGPVDIDDEEEEDDVLILGLSSTDPEIESVD